MNRLMIGLVRLTDRLTRNVYNIRQSRHDKKHFYPESH